MNSNIFHRRMNVALVAVALASACVPPTGGTDSGLDMDTGTDTGDSDAGYLPEAGTLHEKLTMMWDGKERTYHFYEAGGHSELHKRPLVIVLHGGGATIDVAIGIGVGSAPIGRPWLGLAEAEGLHIAYPQALTADPAHGPHWNDCRGTCVYCGTEDDAGFIVALIEDLATRYSVDTTRVYALGESNGGMMAQRLAHEHTGRFAAFGSVITPMADEVDCMAPSNPAPIAFILGTADPIVPYDGGSIYGSDSGSVLSADETIATWSALNQCNGVPTTFVVPDSAEIDNSTVTRDSYDCPATGTEVLLYRVDGGGHVPPSIAEQVSGAYELLVGKQNHDMETTTELWSFFQRHTNPQ